MIPIKGAVLPAQFTMTTPVAQFAQRETSRDFLLPLKNDDTLPKPGGVPQLEDHGSLAQWGGPQLVSISNTCTGYRQHAHLIAPLDFCSGPLCFLDHWQEPHLHRTCSIPINTLPNFPSPQTVLFPDHFNSYLPDRPILPMIAAAAHGGSQRAIDDSFCSSVLPISSQSIDEPGNFLVSQVDSFCATASSHSWRTNVTTTAFESSCADPQQNLQNTATMSLLPSSTSIPPIQMPTTVNACPPAADAGILFGSFLASSGPSSPTSSLFSDVSTSTATTMTAVSQCLIIATFGPEYTTAQSAYPFSTPSPAAESFPFHHQVVSPSPAAEAFTFSQQVIRSSPATDPPLVSSRTRRTKWESLANGGGPSFRNRLLVDNQARVFRRVVDPSSESAARGNGIEISYAFQAQARMDKGFHRIRGRPTAYRRNQTEIFACFTAAPTDSISADVASLALVDTAFTFPCIVQVGSDQFECASFKIHPTVVRTGTKVQIDLLQATRGRARGTMATVEPAVCEPNGWLDIPSIEYLSRRAHFAGIMFACATPDTASRRASEPSQSKRRKKSTAKCRDSEGNKAEQCPATFTVIVDVVAYTRGGERIGVVASCQSEPIIVRSRPPSHYADEDST
ncbi:hypothetical protein BCR44DRAFT_69964 [Catenaria anguillulae PL171]|uniref:Uncharacterized protein n=1 Tax=Catenaria anguillulae PL171 TaxID=765915 RepID=A0A1Y2I341_9FUNG|nr:hypothetical protein BCR44DRAFT_69964 [Catenaria anguillulae PL171]